ncbi:FGGY family carbohydrate kinase (plasmid) [Shinella sp. H4-D48]|uniref:FGGY-family carbohydrate kinase n=1 Tax=Shinella sp. H4-D48 TaxID=2925841 RepID=UPI001F53CD55|nr:FGGY family carbohydrate kinase [Shinella sp. H4-D48]UNK40314.1 FGGY family carbohydrate kinase [Shinella sp. H4-D48]
MTMNGKAYFVGLDGGTGGARAIVVDQDGNVVSMATHDYETTFPRPGWAEQTPADWWRAACLAVRQAVREAGIPVAAVKAISADGTSSTLVALDGNLQPTMPAILWMDSRAAQQARRMTQTNDAALRRSRLGVSSEWMLPKILWIKESTPAIYERSRWFVEMTDYLALCLTGRLTLGLNHITNRWFYDGRRGGWPEDFFTRIGLDDITARFPDEILPLAEPIGPLTSEAADQLGLLPGTLVVCGGTDAYVAMVGLDVCRPGRTAFITGSSHLVLPMTDRDVEVPGIFGPHPDCVVPGLFVMEGGQVSSGSIVRWWHDHIGRLGQGSADTYGDMLRQAESMPIGADGLVALDFWQGNRNPYTDYELQGALWGLTLKHTPAHMLRALIESVAYGTENILRTLRAHAVSIETMVICGGATRTPFLTQMHADVCGIPIAVPKVLDATAFGSAINAAVGAGFYGSLPEASGHMVKESHVVEPDMGRNEAYGAVFEFYRETHEALSPLMHRMARRGHDTPRSGKAVDLALPDTAPRTAMAQPAE